MWKTIRIADFGSVVTGKTPSSNNLEHFGEDYPFITPTDMGAGRIVHTERGISQAGYAKFLRQMLPRSSVCFVCIGATIGKICLTTEKSLTNQQINSVVVDTARHDPFFVYYLLSTFTEAVKRIAGGSATPIINKTSFENIEVLVPDLSTQRKVGAILSGYDDLIENNLRIKVLEEMAQSLYREWFVKFRFPGHARCRFTDSPRGRIPHEWRTAKIKDVADVNAKSIKKEGAPDEIGYVDIASVSPGSIDKIETLAFSDAPSRARRVARHGDIIWSSVRPNRRSFGLIIDPRPNLVVSTGFAVISARTVPFTYLYHAVTTDDFVTYLVNHAKGAAYPAVNAEDFENAKVLVPSQQSLDSFDDKTLPITILADRLRTKNTNLRRTRDLLLPRLISGELDVSDLDIAIGQESDA